MEQRSPQSGHCDLARHLTARTVLTDSERLSKQISSFDICDAFVWLAQLLDWHIHLDKSLPGPLGVIGAWLHRAELSLREDIPIQQAHEETANIIHRKLEQHKVGARTFFFLS